MKWLRVSIFGLLVVFLIATNVALFVVVPRLKAGWAGYDVELPGSLVWFIWMSDIAVQFPYVALPVGIGGCVLVGYMLGVFGSSDGRSG